MARRRTKVLSLDELSELAECLDDACQEWERGGGIIQPREAGNEHQACCPWGALLDTPGKSHPSVAQIQRALPGCFRIEELDHFIRGFDGLGMPAEARSGCSCCDERYYVMAATPAFKLGRFFNERYGLRRAA